MRIVILGAVQVGATLAARLAGEVNDITVVDANTVLLRTLQDRLDIRMGEGASYPSVLAQVGCADADMLVAAINNDEVNMVAFQLAQLLFSIPRKVARIHGSSYLGCADRLFRASAIPVDVLISPDQLVTDHIEQLTL
jgi:trk system potassium uptake protein TrkA